MVESKLDAGFSKRSQLNAKHSNRFIDSTDTDEEGDDGELAMSPGSSSNGNGQFTEGTTSATEWIGITTNSEDCSYSSEMENSDSQGEYSENGGEHDFTPTVILNPCCGNGDRSTLVFLESYLYEEL